LSSVAFGLGVRFLGELKKIVYEARGYLKSLTQKS